MNKYLLFWTISHMALISLWGYYGFTSEGFAGVLISSIAIMELIKISRENKQEANE